MGLYVPTFRLTEVLGVMAERKSLEQLARPLTAADEEDDHEMAGAGSNRPRSGPAAAPA